MAAGRIVIPCRFFPSRITNPNGDWGVWTMTNNAFSPEGVVCPNALDTNINFTTCERIPAWVHATTPNGVLRVYFVSGASSGSLKLFDRVLVVQEETTDLDGTTFSPDSNASKTVNATNRLWHVDFSLTSIAANLVTDRHLAGVVQRKAASDSADTLEASVLITGISLILDDTA